MRARSYTTRSHAFSLIELLVVMAIIALMVGISIPAITSISRSSNLTAAGQMVVNTFALARQAASTQNQQVEIRFYQLVPTGISSAVPVYCAVQLFLVKPSNGGQTTVLQPLNRLTYFPGPVLISSDATASTILSLQSPNASSGPESWPLPGVGTTYNYAGFHFLPSGETDLAATGNWFITLVVANDKIVAHNLPVNYVTARVEPTSGKVTIFRP